MGSSDNSLSECRVGSGSTPPNIADTALVSQVAKTSTRVSTLNGAASVAPYFGWSRITYRFATGVATGNLSEVAVGWATGLFSRALILDPGGTPATISVAADEALDVVYELRCYIPTSDGSGTVNIGGVNYNWTSRASQATSDIWWAAPYGPYVNFARVFFYTGPMGPITGQPSGSSTALPGTRAAYTPGSYKIATTVSAGLAQGNVAGGIKSILFDNGGYLGAGTGIYQLEFDNPIPKDNTKMFSLTVEVSWARRP